MSYKFYPVAADVSRLTLHFFLLGSANAEAHNNIEMVPFFAAATPYGSSEGYAHDVVSHISFIEAFFILLFLAAIIAFFFRRRRP